MSKRKLHNLCIGMKQMVFTSKSPVDEFYFEKSDESLSVSNPLHILLNQKRIDKLGTMGIDQWLSQFDLQKSSALDKLRSECSDEDLISTIKSRHLQSPAELLAWSRKMSQNMDDFRNEISSINEKITSDAAISESNVESNVEPNAI